MSILNGSASLSLAHPQTGSSLAMTCEDSVLVLTTGPLTLNAPSGSCDGELTVDVPEVGTVRITGDNPTVTFTTVPTPILTIVSPNLLVEFTPAGGDTQTFHCSALTLDFSQVPVLPIPPCTT